MEITAVQLAFLQLKHMGHQMQAGYLTDQDILQIVGPGSFVGCIQTVLTKVKAIAFGDDLYSANTFHFEALQKLTYAVAIGLFGPAQAMVYMAIMPDLSPTY
jgi:hypothetical protein